MDSALIRRADADDLPALLDLHERFCVADGHPFSVERATTGFTPLLTDDVRGVVWITADRRAYAVVTWGWSIEAGGAEGLLDEIYVEQRGGGVGSALLDHVLVDSRARGLARVVLETESANLRVRDFYVRHGFAIDHSVWMIHPFVDLT